jgi:hypothetical protein
MVRPCSTVTTVRRGCDIDREAGEDCMRIVAAFDIQNPEGGQHEYLCWKPLLRGH